MVDPSATLLAVVSEADADFPATLFIESAADFVDETGRPYPNQPIDETADVHGPWIVCFSSLAAVETIRADAFLRALLLQDATVKDLPASQIAGYARDERARVIIDPFMATGRKLSPAEFRGHL
jgi:hypothetical protein